MDEQNRTEIFKTVTSLCQLIRKQTQAQEIQADLVKATADLIQAASRFY